MVYYRQVLKGISKVNMKGYYMSIFILIYIILYLFFGLASKCFWVNCLIGIIILIVIIVNFIPRPKNKNNIVNKLSSICLLLIMIPFTFFNIISIPPQVIGSKNDIVINISNRERLKIVPYGDMRIGDRGSLWYEQDLLLGFKYMIEIKENINLKEDRDYYLKIFYES